MSRSEQQQIVITGMGWVTPLGFETEPVWSRLLKGTSGVTPIRHFDASTFPTQIAGQVPVDYDYRSYVEHPELHEGVGSNTQFALGAAGQAWTMAGLDDAEIDPARLGIYLGSGEGSLDFDNYVACNLEAWSPDDRAVDAAAWTRAARQRLDYTREIEQEPNMPLTHLALEFDAQGPAYNCLTACAASTQAIGEACEILRRGAADVMITGGAHTMIHPFGVTGFNRLTALSNRNDAPAAASRPFSRDRDGFVLGEGGGIIILESLAHARARGAKPLATIRGYGSSADAFRITDMHPTGRGPAASMQAALDDAGVKPTDIHWIAAHGTSTKENDSIETLAIKSVFGDHAPNVPVSSVKSMMGHLIAAAGVIQAIAAVLALRDQKVPPTINLNNPDPECDLNYVPNEARAVKLETVLSNSFGFGGQNDTLVIGRA